MSRGPILVLLLALLGPIPLAAQQGALACGPGQAGVRVTVVLSGGGAKGFAHIGVLQALDAANIAVDRVVGTSMGSLVGALYASGMSGQAIDSMARQEPVRSLFLAPAPRGPEAWGGQLPLLRWNEGERGFALQLTPQRTDFEVLLSAVLLDANLRAAGDFHALRRPLSVVATDVATRESVVLTSGDLAQAVRASIAVPILFTPQRIGGALYTDGGISANRPIRHARGPDEVGLRPLIVSDVTGRPAEAPNLESPLGMAERLVDWLFLQPLDSLRSEDLLIRPSIDGFTAFDYTLPAIDSLIRRGREAGEAMVRDWPCRQAAQYVDSVPAGPTAGYLLPAVVGEVTGPAGEEASRRVAIEALRLRTGEPVVAGSVDRVSTAALAQRLVELARRDVLREIWLTPTTARRPGAIDFHPVIRPLPRRVAGLGVAYDGDLGGSLWVGYLDRRHPVLDAEIAVMGQLSRYRSTAELAARRPTLLGQSTFSPVGVLQVRGEETRRIGPDNREAGRDLAREAVLRGGVERYVTRSLRLTVGAEGRSQHQTDPLTRRSGSVTRVGGFLLLERLGAGGQSRGRVELLAGRHHRLARLENVAHARMGTWRAEHRVRLGLGERLPASHVFALGGDRGFPGLPVGARRGDREASAALTLSHPILGPLRFRLTGAVGHTSWRHAATTTVIAGEEIVAGRSLVPGEGWLRGVRAGVGADTPFGPLVLEYGVASGGRDAFFLRLGW